MIPRRALLSAIPALIYAPAIVRASSLMPVKAWSDSYNGVWTTEMQGARVIREVFRHHVRMALIVNGRIIDETKFSRWQHGESVITVGAVPT